MSPQSIVLLLNCAREAHNVGKYVWNTHWKGIWIFYLSTKFVLLLFFNVFFDYLYYWLFFSYFLVIFRKIKIKVFLTSSPRTRLLAKSVNRICFFANGLSTSNLSWSQRSNYAALHLKLYPKKTAPLNVLCAFNHFWSLVTLPQEMAYV